MEAPTYGKGQYRIPLKAQKARTLGLEPQGASRLRDPAGAHTGLLRFWEEEKGKTEKEGENW